MSIQVQPTSLIEPLPLAHRTDDKEDATVLPGVKVRMDYDLALSLHSLTQRISASSRTSVPYVSYSTSPHEPHNSRSTVWVGCVGHGSSARLRTLPCECPSHNPLFFLGVDSRLYS